jgi:hypothetical protein
MNKAEQISEIKRILRDCCEGSTSPMELEANSSPCISSVGNKPNVSTLVEKFSDDGVIVVAYVDETEISSDFKEYEDLSEEIIDEIYNLLEQYEVGLEKTFKRCQD